MRSNRACGFCSLRIAEVPRAQSFAAFQIQMVACKRETVILPVPIDPPEFQAYTFACGQRCEITDPPKGAQCQKWRFLTVWMQLSNVE